TGSADVVSEDGSPFGSGWTYSGTDQLVSIPADANGPAGVLRLYGTGGWDFYTGSGGSFTSPAGDNGTLSQSGATYTYPTPDGQTEVFNSAGFQTSWTSPDGQQKLLYRYNGSNQLTGVTAIDGALSTISYNGSNLASTIQTVNSRTTALAYSGT